MDQDQACKDYCPTLDRRCKEVANRLCAGEEPNDTYTYKVSTAGYLLVREKNEERELDVVLYDKVLQCVRRRLKRREKAAKQQSSIKKRYQTPLTESNMDPPTPKPVDTISPASLDSSFPVGESLWSKACCHLTAFQLRADESYYEGNFQGLLQRNEGVRSARVDYRTTMAKNMLVQMYMQGVSVHELVMVVRANGWECKSSTHARWRDKAHSCFLLLLQWMFVS